MSTTRKRKANGKAATEPEATPDELPLALHLAKVLRQSFKEELSLSATDRDESFVVMSVRLLDTIVQVLEHDDRRNVSALANEMAAYTAELLHLSGWSRERAALDAAEDFGTNPGTTRRRLYERLAKAAQKGGAK